MAKDTTKTGNEASNDKPDGTPPAPQPAVAQQPASAPAPAAAVAKGESDGRSDFTVTERAGPRVAGRRVKKGDTLRLTAEEARSDLLAGALVRKGQKLHEQLRKGAKPRDPITKKPIGEAASEAGEIEDAA